METQLSVYRQRVEHALEGYLPTDERPPQRLHRAMRYAVLGGGKRIRPILVYASGDAVEAAPACLDAPACAVELIHAYSLVHDDLPAMDDDDLRRGQPTCHRAFDEATAILAGDGLQALAFQILAEPLTTAAEGSYPPPALRLAMVQILAQAAGSQGMVGGQAIDLAAMGQRLTLPELENMHLHKTGALIRACVRLGVLCQPNHDPEQLERLDHFAKCIGLAFQIRDDILDETSDTETLGKAQGADRARNKPTYPALLGLRGAHEHAQALYESAMDSLRPFDQRADLLRWLAHYIVKRKK